MKKQTTHTESFWGALIRRLLTSWLLAVALGLWSIPAELRALDGLTCLSAMPGGLVLGLTGAGTGLLYLLPRFVRIRRLEPWLMAGAFGLALTSGLWVSFSWAFLVAGLMILAILVVYALRGWEKESSPLPAPEKKQGLWLWVTAGLAVVFVVLVSCWTVSRVLCFGTYTYDLGIFSQMFYSMKETGLPLTILEQDGLLSHFHVHVSPIYYLMLPFYALVPRPETLQVLQAVVLASAVIPLWRLCGLHGLTGARRGLMCALLLLQPALAGGTAYDLHENCFLTPLLLWLLYGLDKKSTPITLCAAMLTLLVKEDAAVYVAVAALFALLRTLLQGKNRSRKDLLTALGLLLGALVWFFLVTGYLNRVGKGVMSWRYDNLMYEGSGSLVTVVKAVFLNPIKALYECVDPEKLGYMACIMIPLLGLPLLTRRYERFVLLIPFILVNLLTDYTYQHHIFHQYNFGSLAFLLYMSLVNLAQLKTDRRKTLALLLAVAVSTGFFAKTVLPKVQEYTQKAQQYRERYDAIRQALSRIPQDASVAATTFYTTFLSQREVLYDVRYARQSHVLEAEYVALGLASSGDFKLYNTGNDNGRENLIRLLEEEGYVLDDELPGILLIYRRAG